MFDTQKKINEQCAEWCLKTRSSDEGKTYNETDDKFR